MGKGVSTRGAEVPIPPPTTVSRSLSSLLMAWCCRLPPPSSLSSLESSGKGSGKDEVLVPTVLILSGSSGSLDHRLAMGDLLDRLHDTPQLAVALLTPNDLHGRHGLRGAVASMYLQV